MEPGKSALNGLAKMELSSAERRRPLVSPGLALVTLAAEIYLEPTVQRIVIGYVDPLPVPSYLTKSAGRPAVLPHGNNVELSACDSTIFPIAAGVMISLGAFECCPTIVNFLPEKPSVGP
jgi:hypothetical protein